MMQKNQTLRWENRLLGLVNLILLLEVYTFMVRGNTDLLRLKLKLTEQRVGLLVL